MGSKKIIETPSGTAEYEKQKTENEEQLLLFLRINVYIITYFLKACLYISHVSDTIWTGAFKLFKFCQIMKYFTTYYDK